MIDPSDRLIDSFGRVHNNLRISVTDRCNIRCTYCMPETVRFLPRADLLTFEEIERFVRVAAGLGIDKVRLTGGEPLVRRDLPDWSPGLPRVPGIVDVGLTTNGILLAPMARALRDAGLRRINVSLDTMDPARFRELTRRDGWEQVIEGILAAKAAGFDPVKLNAIAIKGVTEDDVVPLGRSPASTAWNSGSSSTCRSTPATSGSGTRSSSPTRSSTGSPEGSAPSPPRPTRTRGPRRWITTTSTAGDGSA